jgi:hypothetical protein
MKPTVFQRYTHDPDPIMRHFAGQNRRRLLSRPWFRAVLLSCIIFVAYFAVRLLLGSPVGNDADIALLIGLTFILVCTSLLIPCVVGTLVSFTLANLGENQFLQDIKLTLISHRRIFYYLHAGSMRRLLPLVYSIQLTLLACWGHAFISFVFRNSWMNIDDLTENVIFSLLVFTFLEVVLLRPWLDTRAAIMAGWHYTLTGRSRFNAGMKAFGVCFAEILATSISCYLIAYIASEVFDNADEVWIAVFLLINIGACLIWIFQSARMNPLSKRLGFRRRFVVLNLVIIGLNFILLPLTWEEDATFFFIIMHYLVFSPLWLIKIYRTFDRYGQLMEHWPVLAEARLGASN